MQLRTPSRIRRKGFTLIELMVVVLILAVLAALVVPKIVGAGGTAKAGAAKSDIASIQNLLDQFQLDCGRYPTAEEGLDALTNPPSGLESKWKGPYSRKPVLNDPWEHPYVYTSTGTTYTISSYGADGTEGGEGENADITEQG